MLWAPLIENRRIRAATLRLVLEAITELLRFGFKLWLPPDVLAFRAEAVPWYGNGFSTLRVLQATPNSNEAVQSTPEREEDNLSKRCETCIPH